jgi:hypothetical protein
MLCNGILKVSFFEICDQGMLNSLNMVLILKFETKVGREQDMHRT